ncbi:MAG: hypothetical protein REI78_07380 [Pedobacter sp.]|nr:hypothetical protein [Pedobacter sp.]MDQ8052831.1 hypothetical protein [Pedobacter sp.]
MDKKQLPIVFFGAVALVSFLCLNHLYYSRTKNDVNNIQIEEIGQVSIQAKGAAGHESVQINDIEKIIQIVLLLKSAEKVQCANEDLNKNAYQISLKSRNGTTQDVLLSKLSGSAYMLQSGQYCYRTDSLWKVVSSIKQLQPKP